MSNEQLTRLPPAHIDWQARAEEAERLVAEFKSGLAHAQGDLFAAQLRVAALETEADKATAELQWLRGVVETHEATLASVREVAERHAVLDVSNGSWKAAARDVAGRVLRALEGK